ncbi:hypothetical protein AB852_02795 [Streptomyces uncialis]|uniref:Uncharacterized protein n=1 Tax=Streptomyces uncialis TaxID=1048205 RepID=A0A1Q4VCX7_9ACTN|nr:hypothetical protein [Streptomyces uncialis]OKH95707.1 hypothetical protein AB852_02795 [Streptomyces uncialis]
MTHPGSRPTSSVSLRLLPWLSPEGKPSYLATDSNHGYLSRFADHVEAVQIDMARTLLDHACELLNEPKASPRELRFVATRLMEALADTLRVAQSRGQRLTVTDDPPDPPDGNCEMSRPAG